MNSFNKTNVSRQSNASRITPNKKNASKVMTIKDNKDAKDPKSSKIGKLNVSKPGPALPFKGLSKLAQYSYNKSSSNRNMDPKPAKPNGVLSKFVVELSNSKQ